jgi:biotin carboxyl carrier protein
MSSNPHSEAEAMSLEEKRRQINQLIEEIARLAESNLAPLEFAAEFLQRLVTALAASAGVLWNRTQHGNLQLQYQINFQEIGLDLIENGRDCHEQLIRHAVQLGRSMIVPPRSGPQFSGQGTAPANLSNFVLILVPIIVEKQVAGIIEIWVDADRNPQAVKGFLQFVEDMAGYASTYLKNNQLRQMLGQQQVWSQLEAYARSIHSSLNPREVGFLIVNEARRLLACDRVSLAARLGSWTEVEAISGADVIEKRSALVKSQRELFDAVLVWNEKLVYAGTKDESLPPKVLEALDQFLTESNSKLLVVMPIRDDRETDKDRPCRVGMMIECFEPNVTAEQILSQVNVIARHAAPAMYNAVEHRRIPFRWALMPVANLRDTLRGNNLAIAMAAIIGVIVLTLAMVFVPYPLRMTAKGKLMPKERQTIYSNVNGQINAVRVKHGDVVRKNDELFTVYDVDKQQQYIKLESERAMAQQALDSIQLQLNNPNLSETDKAQLRIEATKKKTDLSMAIAQLDTLVGLVRDPKNAAITAPISGTVVTFDLSEMNNRVIKPGDKLLQIAKVDGRWEVELRIPENHVGQVREALSKLGSLEVDLFLKSHPDRRWKGYLHREGLGGEMAVTDNETVLTARVEVGPELAAKLEELSGGAMAVETEVVGKVRCGNRSIGYVLFYQLWEFLYEHVIF